MRKQNLKTKTVGNLFFVRGVEETRYNDWGCGQNLFGEES